MKRTETAVKSHLSLRRSLGEVPVLGFKVDLPLFDTASYASSPVNSFASRILFIQRRTDNEMNRQSLKLTLLELSSLKFSPTHKYYGSRG
jgi:hypothetical protein